MTRPKTIGITGGIGAGKSTIAKVFEEIGVPVYYADDRAKWLMNHNPELKTQIQEAFGDEAYLDGTLNRRYLAAEVFNDQSKVTVLNRMVHPAVGKDFEVWTHEHSEQPYVMKEAALLFETGSYKELDATLLVTVSEDVRIQRVLKRDPFRSLDEVKAIIDKQMPEEQKLQLATFVIKNESEELVLPQLLEFHQKFLALD